MQSSNTYLPIGSRRSILKAVASGVALSIVPNGRARATPDSLAIALRETFGEAEIRPGRVHLEIALIAEDGGIVPATVRVDSPMTEADHVTEIHLFSEKNPLPRIAAFALGSANGRAQVSTRIRLADSQRVIAIARLNDGSLWSDEAQVEVSLAACGG
ncbi:MAG: thiosulfate oxidation carrier protein SoxY [Betaproteobacteria bacterium]